ncbi:hypothetical protein QCA50_013650 [Cerrena zonata]|uniref:3,4-dihydroxy-2-butanone 4-phosphate synthase n=1 Tax=Cerrena zonata TaxID=2478898 RepID=A0AAW0G0F5_9APHY
MAPVAITQPPSTNSNTIPMSSKTQPSSSPSTTITNSNGSIPPPPPLPRNPAAPKRITSDSLPSRNADESVLDSMESALEAFGSGEFLVVVDDEGRENEGDLIIAASECSTEKMAWMIRYTSGYICCSLPGERLDELEIPMMVSENQELYRTAYTVTVDYKYGTTTGISAHDRALSARALASQVSTSSHFNRPGHLVPLRARSGGVLTRQGHTESGVDLCALTNLPKAGLLCELVLDEEDVSDSTNGGSGEDYVGGMMRRDACRRFADRWGLKMISVEMIRAWRRDHEDRTVV